MNELNYLNSLFAGWSKLTMCFLSISVQLHWKDSRSKGKLTAKTSGRDGMPHGCVRPRIDERQREGENDDRSSVELVVSSRGNGIARAGLFCNKIGAGTHLQTSGAEKSFSHRISQTEKS